MQGRHHTADVLAIYIDIDSRGAAMPPSTIYDIEYRVNVRSYTETHDLPE